MRARRAPGASDSESAAAAPAVAGGEHQLAGLVVGQRARGPRAGGCDTAPIRTIIATDLGLVRQKPETTAVW